MFQTRIASDAVAHQTGLGARWVFAPTPAGSLWFATLAQLQSLVPNDLPVRVKTSLLMLDYQADELSAAAALIANDAALRTHRFDGIQLSPAAAALVSDEAAFLPRPLVDPRVQQRAAAFSAACDAAELTKTTDVVTWLFCLAAITARCRAGFDEYRITLETPSDWGDHHDITRRLSHWRRQLDLIDWKVHRCGNRQWAPRIDSALADCRDALLLAETAFERAGNRLDSLLHVCLNGTPKAIDDFLRGPARRFCLAWRRVSSDTVVVRSEELPTPVAVRLFDGLAAEFKHLAFSAAAPDARRRFQGGCRYEADYDRLLWLMEPAFFSENIAPMDRILHRRPLRCLWRVSGAKVDVLRFRKATVKAFGLDCQIASTGHSILLWGRRLSGTAMTSLMRCLSGRFPRLIFHPAKRPESRKRFLKVRRPPSRYLEFLQWPFLVDRQETDLKRCYQRWEKASRSLSTLQRNPRRGARGDTKS